MRFNGNGNNFADSSEQAWAKKLEGTVTLKTGKKANKVKPSNTSFKTDDYCAKHNTNN